MDKVTMRAYFLPDKLVEALDCEAKRCGYTRKKAVAAAMAGFLKSDPDARACMFDQLDKFLKGKTK